LYNINRKRENKQLPFPSSFSSMVHASMYLNLPLPQPSMVQGPHPSPGWQLKYKQLKENAQA
jgi:hypothetical protein